MSNIRGLAYRPSLATLTDLYELTMAAGYVETGMADREAVFNLTFRARPFHGGYAVAAGLADAIEVLETLRFAPRTWRTSRRFGRPDGARALPAGLP